MARGRLISNQISRDKKINELSDDTSRLAFTWLVTFADREGRTHGDPAVVRSMIFPRRDDITFQQMETYIQEWHDAELILWYEAEGDKWISFPNFDKHQLNLRKDREAVSIIPAPPGQTPPMLPDKQDDTPDEVHQDSGESPEQIPVKLSLTEDNLSLSSREDNIGASAPPPTPPNPKESTNSPPEEKPPEKINLEIRSTPGGRVLYALLEIEKRAKEHKMPEKWPSVTCRDDWLRDCEGRLKPDDLKAAINDALHKPILDLPGIASYVSAWDPEKSNHYSRSGKKKMEDKTSPDARKKYAEWGS